MKTESISFSELKELTKFNDRNSAVLLGVNLDEVDNQEEEFKNLNNLLSNEIGFSKGKNLIGVHRITGNVLGDEGRHDWVLEFDNEDVMFNCIARLRCGQNLKWVSDFVDNYVRDYEQD